MKFLKKIQYFINFFLNKFGLEIIRRFNEVDERFEHSLKYKKIDCLIDVGANEGQFGVYLRKINFNKKIISFEPLTEAFQKLRTKALRDNNWKVFNYALGDKEKDEIINISANSVSSSILKINENHLETAAESEIIKSEKIKVKRLDKILLSETKNYNKIFLKVDTQGYEDKVLDGAKNIINKIEGIRVEMSLKPLYENSLSFEDLYKKIIKMDYILWDLSTAFVHRKTAQVLQLDAVFFKNENKK